MPLLLLQILQGLQLAAQAGPVAAQIYENGRQTIDLLFRGGIITAAQQAETKAWADAHETATLNGTTHPALLVEADPT